MTEFPYQSPTEAFLEAMNTLPLALSGAIPQTSYLRIVDRTSHVWSNRCAAVIAGLELYMVTALTHAQHYIREQRLHFDLRNRELHLKWKREIEENMIPLYNLMGLHAAEIPALGFTTPPYDPVEIPLEVERLLRGEAVRADWPYVCEPRVRMIRLLMERVLSLLQELVNLEPFLPELEAVSRALMDTCQAGHLHHIYELNLIRRVLNQRLLSQHLSAERFIALIRDLKLPAHLTPSGPSSLTRQVAAAAENSAIPAVFEGFFRRYRDCQ